MMHRAYWAISPVSRPTPIANRWRTRYSAQALLGEIISTNTIRVVVICNGGLVGVGRTTSRTASRITMDDGVGYLQDSASVTLLWTWSACLYLAEKGSGVSEGWIHEFPRRTILAVPFEDGAYQDAQGNQAPFLHYYCFTIVMLERQDYVSLFMVIDCILYSLYLC